MDERPGARRSWTGRTTLIAIGVSAAAAVLLVVAALLTPVGTVTETDHSGARVWAIRLAGGVFVSVVLLSCLLQAALLLPQPWLREEPRRRTFTGAVDLLIAAAVVTLTALVLAQGRQDDGVANDWIAASAGAIVLGSVVRFLVVVAVGAQALLHRRSAR